MNTPYKTEVVAKFDSATFTAAAEEFFKDKRDSKVNGLPTVSLLLWCDPVTGHYVWYAIAGKDKLNEIIESSMAKKLLIPVGAALVTFRNQVVGDKAVIKLDGLPTFVHEIFDAEEVLNGTIPYFMREQFGYEIGMVNIRDLSKN